MYVFTETSHKSPKMTNWRKFWKEALRKMHLQIANLFFKLKLIWLTKVSGYKQQHYQLI